MNMIYNTAGNKLKQYYASPLCLMAFIFGCGYFLLSVVSIFFNANGAMTDIMSNIGNSNPYIHYDVITQSVGSGVMVSEIISCIFVGILVAGLGLVYFMSKGNGSPSSGFTIIQVYGIFGIITSVLLGLLIVLIIILGALMFAGGSFLADIFRSYDFGSVYKGTALDDYGDYGDFGDIFGDYGTGIMDMAMPILITVFIISIVILLAVFVITLLYSINMTRFAGSMKKGLREPYLHVKGASFFGVVSVILGAVILLGSVSAVGTVAFNSGIGYAIVQLIGSLCSAGMYIVLPVFGLVTKRLQLFIVSTHISNLW